MPCEHLSKGKEGVARQQCEACLAIDAPLRHGVVFVLVVAVLLLCLVVFITISRVLIILVSVKVRIQYKNSINIQYRARKWKEGT